MSIMSGQLALAELIGGGLGAAARGWKENKEEKERFQTFLSIIGPTGLFPKITADNYSDIDDVGVDLISGLGARNATQVQALGAVESHRVKDVQKAIKLAQILGTGSPAALEATKLHWLSPKNPQVKMILEDIKEAKKDFWTLNPSRDPATQRKMDSEVTGRVAEALVLGNNLTTKKLETLVANYEYGQFSEYPATLEDARKAAIGAGDQFKNKLGHQAMMDKYNMHDHETTRFNALWEAMTKAGYSREYIDAFLSPFADNLDRLEASFGMAQKMAQIEQNEIDRPNSIVMENPDSPTGYGKGVWNPQTESYEIVPNSVVKNPGQPGIDVTTTIMPPNERKGLEATAQMGARQVEEAHASMKQVQTAEALLNEMERVTDYAGKGGSLAGIRLEMMELGQSLGFEMEGLDETQMFKRLQNALALSFRSPEGPLGGLTGNTSDRDIKFLLELPPALTNTPKGRRMAIDMWQKVFSRNREYAKEIEKFYASEGPGKEKYTTIGWAQYWEDFRNAQDVFDEEDRQKINTGIDRERAVRMAELQKENPGLDEDDILMMMLDEGW